VRESWHERFAETPDVLKSAQRQRTTVPVLDLEIGGGDFIVMAGPCAVETEAQLMATANHVRRGGARILRGGAFKPRSSPYAFQGLGLEGLKLLARARQETGLAIVTEVISEDDVPMVAEYADILQIGSRNMENYSLLEAAARSGCSFMSIFPVFSVRSHDAAYFWLERSKASSSLVRKSAASLRSQPRCLRISFQKRLMSSSRRRCSSVFSSWESASAPG